MDFAIKGIANRKHLVLTDLKGFDRSRFLLKVELQLLTNGFDTTSGKIARRNSDTQGGARATFRRIYHVVDDDDLLRKIYNETSQLPFADFQLGVAKIYSTSSAASLLNRSDPLDAQLMAPLVLIHVQHLFERQRVTCKLDREDAILIFDGISLDKLEDYCFRYQLEVREESEAVEGPNKRQRQLEGSDTSTLNTSVNSNGGGVIQLDFTQMSMSRQQHQEEPNKRKQVRSEPSEDSPLLLPIQGFQAATSHCWSVLLACQPPVDGLEHELGYQFQVASSCHHKAPFVQTFGQQRIFSSVIVNDELKYLTGRPYEKVARYVLDCLENMKSVRTLLFLRDSQQAADYYAAWTQMECFKRKGYDLFCDSDQLVGPHARNVLIDFYQHPGGKAILLTTHTYNENSSLAEYVFSSCKLILFLALPRPLGIQYQNDRVAHANTRFALRYPSTALNGYDLLFYRGLEKLNGSVRKCLSEFRFTDCAIFILCPWLAGKVNKLTSELADVRVELFEESIERFESFCRL